MLRPEVFISYSHRDAPEKERLSEHLMALNVGSEPLTDAWHDGLIEPGMPWNDVIQTALWRSDLFLFLVSVSAINSAECQKELSIALEGQAQGHKRVFPILIKSGNYGPTLSSLQWLGPTKPLARYSEREEDEFYTKVTTDLIKVVHGLHEPVTSRVHHSRILANIYDVPKSGYDEELAELLARLDLTSRDLDFEGGRRLYRIGVRNTQLSLMRLRQLNGMVIGGRPLKVRVITKVGRPGNVI